jgi:predicted DNA-binding transcriptional regulator YafY
MLEGTFTVPDDFDLPAYWDASKARFEDSLTRGSATLQLSERADRCWRTFGARVARLARNPLDSSIVTVPLEPTDKAAREFLAFGDTIEVLGSPELRTRIASLASATAALYC